MEENIKKPNQTKTAGEKRGKHFPIYTYIFLYTKNYMNIIFEKIFLTVIKKFMLS